MKKFLSNKWSFISFVSASVLLLGLLLFMVLRPISYGLGGYAFTESTGESMTVVFNNEKKVTVIMKDDGLVETSDSWYLSNGRKMIIFDSVNYMTEEDYNEIVDEIKSNGDEFWGDEENYYKISAFKAIIDGAEYVNYGAIWLTVAIGVITLTVIGFAIPSGMLFFKENKIKEKKVAKTKKA